MHPTDPLEPNGPRRELLYCSACGNTVWCHPTDLLRYVQVGWPKCCGEVMALLTEGDEGDQTPNDAA
jgi:hypothetical protein